jgi:hypothetical protein
LFTIFEFILELFHIICSFIKKIKPKLAITKILEPSI